MASFGDGFTRGFHGGVALGEKWNKAGEERQKNKLFGAAMGGREVDEARNRLIAEDELLREEEDLMQRGEKRNQVMSMFGNASQGDITQTIVDNFAANGGKVNDQTYKLAAGVAGTLFGVAQEEKKYQMDGEMHKAKLFDMDERRRLTSEKNKTDSAMLDLDTQYKKAQIAKTQQDTIAKQQKTRDDAIAVEKASSDAVDSANNVIGTIETIQKHPGLNGALGMSSWMGAIPGTDARDAAGLIKTLESQTFVATIKQMKGMGALSDAEGKKLAAAVANLDVGQSEESFKKNLNVALGIFKRARDKAKSMGGQSGNSQVQTQKQNRQVVRRGTANGRPVVKYSDGSVEYAD